MRKVHVKDVPVATGLNAPREEKMIKFGISIIVVGIFLLGLSWCNAEAREISRDITRGGKVSVKSISMTNARRANKRMQDIHTDAMRKSLGLQPRNTRNININRSYSVPTPAPKKYKRRGTF